MSRLEDRMISEKSDMLKEMKEISKKIDAVRQTPEWKEYIEKLELYEGFQDHIKKKRIDKTYDLIVDIFKDEDKVEEWVGRIKNLHTRLSESNWKRGYTFSSSNVMDFVWKVFVERGNEIQVDGFFTMGTYEIEGYYMEMYSGQGEYGYIIRKMKRIF